MIFIMKQTISCQLDSTLAERLKQEADAHYLSSSAWLRLILLMHFKEEGAENYVKPQTEADVEVEQKHSQVRVALSEKSTAKYRHKKQGYIDMVRTPCVKCKETRKYVIDFHHIDPAIKLYNINKVIKGHSWDALREELKKCICLCRNCHQEFHYQYGNLATKADLLEYLSCDEATLEQYKPKV